jgi:hypothetical protein
MEKVRIKGSQGSWEAEVRYEDGHTEILACLHDHFWRNTPDGPYYNDPWTPELRTTAKFLKHVEVIKSTGRVIMTSDKIDPSKERGAAGYFTRTGYIAVFTIDNFVLDEDSMRFRFVRRIANPK